MNAISEIKADATGIVPFTQFMLPHGRQVEVSIEVAADAADKAGTIIARGFRFECEVLRTEQVSLTITDPKEGDADIRIVPNGPGVRSAVESLIRNFELGA